MPEGSIDIPNDYAHLGPIWYHSEPSDVPYSTNQFLALDFFAISYSHIVLVYITILFYLTIWPHCITAKILI